MADKVRVASTNDVPPGSGKEFAAAGRVVALFNVDGQFYALDGVCPHQGGPLGEGSIEIGNDGQCWLRCPWHGWDFDPQTGLAPGGHEDSGQRIFPTEVREDGIYVGLEAEPARAETVTDVMAETMTNWGVTTVFGMVGHSNLGLADALRLQEKRGRLRYFGIRHEGAAAFACSGYAKLTGKPAACLTIAGPGATNMITGMWDAHVDNVPLLALVGQVNTQVMGPGAFQEVDLNAALNAVTRWQQVVLGSDNASDLVALAIKHAEIEHAPTIQSPVVIGIVL